MTFTKIFYVLLALMIACGTVVSLGNLDPNVSFEAARQLWSDVLRDVDDFGLQASRVSAYKEMEFGAQLNAATATWSKENPAATQYVNAVGQQLLPYIHRNAIRYHFHVVESPEVNAFALPGGHVYVFTGMLRSPKSITAGSAGVITLSASSLSRPEPFSRIPRWATSNRFPTRASAAGGRLVRCAIFTRQSVS